MIGVTSPSKHIIKGSGDAQAGNLMRLLLNLLFGTALLLQMTTGQTLCSERNELQQAKRAKANRGARGEGGTGGPGHQPTDNESQ